MLRAWRCLSLVFLMSLAMLASTAEAYTQRLVVAGLGNKQCTAYFHYMGASMVWPVLLSLRGTGIYSTAAVARLDGAERRLYEEGRITVLTLDKPGIEPDALVPTALRVDDTKYNDYVQDDLVQCSRNAMTWAMRRVTPGAHPYLLFSGHSEGAQITVRLLEMLTANGDPLAPQVKALFLSGLPMVDWRSMLKAQLNQNDRRTFFTAFQRQDDHVLRSFGNLSFHYLKAVFAQEPLARTLDRLRDEGTSARFFVYHGLYDRNTPPAAVMTFAADNRARRARHEKALNLSARYYPSGHGLNYQAIHDIRSDLETVVGALGHSSDAQIAMH